MSLDRAMDISLSGLQAQRLSMELIASNVANISTTRTLAGGPYRRRVPILAEKSLSFAEELGQAQGRLSFKTGGGVEVSDVVEESSPFQKVYKPEHPDADTDGFLSMPNVSLSTEMTDLIYTSKLYEANITAFNATKKMMQDTLQIQ